MKITRIDAHAVDVDGRSSWVFVQVHTDAGMHGLGEMNPSAPREKCLAALQGRDPRCIEALSAMFEPANSIASKCTPLVRSSRPCGIFWASGWKLRCTR